MTTLVNYRYILLDRSGTVGRGCWGMFGGQLGNEYKDTFWLIGRNGWEGILGDGRETVGE